MVKIFDKSITDKVQQAAAARGLAFAITPELIKAGREEDVGKALTVVFDILAEYEQRIKALEGGKPV